MKTDTEKLIDDIEERHERTVRQDEDLLELCDRETWVVGLLRSWNVSWDDRATLIKEYRKLEGRLKAAELKLNELTYRHECLKSMHEDEMNYIDPHSVDVAIDEFISEEQSHS